MALFAEKPPYKRLLIYFLKEEKKDLLSLVNYGIWIGCCSLIIPIAIQMFVNTIGFGLLLQPLVILTFVVFSVLVFLAIIEGLKFSLVETLQARLFAKTVLKLAYLIPRVQGEIFQKSPSHEWVNRIFELPLVQKAIASILIDGTVVVLQIVFGMVLVAFYHPFLLGLNILIFIIGGFVFWFYMPPAIETSILESKAKHDLISWLNQVALNSDAFSVKAARDFALKRADQLSSHYTVYRHQHYQVVFKQLMGFLFLQILTNSILLGVGGWLIIQEQLTVGQLVASELVVSAVIAGVAKIAKHLESYYDMVASFDKIAQLLDLPMERVEGELLTRRNEIPLKVTQAAFVNAFGRQLAHPLSFDLKKNQLVLLQGPVGSGKTRLLRSIMGLEEPSRGHFEFFGMEHRYLGLDQIRQVVGFLGEVHLFSGTILDNLRLFNPNVTVSMVQDILHRFPSSTGFGWVHTLPDGLNTQILGPWFPLSRVQAEQLLLVRGLLSQTEILLVDQSAEYHSLSFWKAFCEIARAQCSVLFATTDPQCTLQSLVDTTVRIALIEDGLMEGSPQWPS
jgi:ABC-type bacteriocin/lantibiotic exporter with double-glycine peptidase domain